MQADIHLLTEFGIDVICNHSTQTVSYTHLDVYKRQLPTPAKDDYVFVNWKMENGDVYYPLTEVVSADMTLTAVYEPVESKEQLNITSFSLDNQKPDVFFAVTCISSRQEQHLDRPKPSRGTLSTPRLSSQYIFREYIP